MRVGAEPPGPPGVQRQDELAYLFRATELTPGPSAPEGTERIEVRIVEWIEAWEMLRVGAITDSLTVIALLHEAVRRSKEEDGGGR